MVPNQFGTPNVCLNCVQQELPAALPLCKHAYIDRKGLTLPLSYCWGGVLPRTLVTSTFDQFCAGIVVNDLPRTFVDAVHVTQYLGIRYLWIDALTVIQDSSTDWSEQASPMGAVHQNTFINIGASASSNSNVGSFRQRGFRGLCSSLMRLGDDNHALVDATQWITCVDLSPLLCFREDVVTQERLLCRKMLHSSN